MGCDHALKILRPRHWGARRKVEKHGCSRWKLDAGAPQSSPCGHDSLLSEYRDRESAVGRVGQAAERQAAWRAGSLELISSDWPPLLTHQPKGVLVDGQKHPAEKVGYRLMQQAEVFEEQTFSCIQQVAVITITDWIHIAHFVFTAPKALYIEPIAHSHHIHTGVGKLHVSPRRPLRPPASNRSHL